MWVVWGSKPGGGSALGQLTRGWKRWVWNYHYPLTSFSRNLTCLSCNLTLFSLCIQRANCLELRLGVKRGSSYADGTMARKRSELNLSTHLAHAQVVSIVGHIFVLMPIKQCPFRRNHSFAVRDAISQSTVALCDSGSSYSSSVLQYSATAFSSPCEFVCPLHYQY